MENIRTHTYECSSITDGKAECIRIRCYQNRILSVHSRHSTRLYHKHRSYSRFFCSLLLLVSIQISNGNCLLEKLRFDEIVVTVYMDFIQLTGSIKKVLIKYCLCSSRVERKENRRSNENKPKFVSY